MVDDEGDRGVVEEVDLDAEFKRVDEDGSGYISFDEFCDWGIRMRLDLEDDDDPETGWEEPSK